MPQYFQNKTQVDSYSFATILAHCMFSFMWCCNSRILVLFTGSIGLFVILGIIMFVSRKNVLVQTYKGKSRKGPK